MKQEIRIHNIIGREILDSRGNPTVEVDVILEGNGYEAYNFSGGFRLYEAVMHDRTLVEAAFDCGMDQ